jgi:hypothetical protein
MHANTSTHHACPTPTGELPPPPPCPLLPEVLASQGLAYKTDPEGLAAAILWILPPKLGLDPAKTYPVRADGEAG